jgi:hypothetical protein
MQAKIKKRFTASELTSYNQLHKIEPGFMGFATTPIPR